MGWMKDETGLEKTPANFVPLTPLSHLARAARVFPNREAVVDGAHRKTYAQYHARVSRLASALTARGITPGDVVATVLPNTYPHAEAHFGVPAAGAVLNAINIRLDAGTVAYILNHGEAVLVLADTQFLPLVEAAIATMDSPAPIIIEVPDADAGHPATGRYTTYEDLLAEGDPDAPWVMPQDEWESIALNYTSGTTGRPKGVVYHHRGAYLITMGTPISWRMVLYPVYLTIVPMFHCNNWCHTWMMPAVGGTIICCRDISAQSIYGAIVDEGVTHFGGAPIVLNLLVNAKDADRRAFDHTVEVFTAGAPPRRRNLGSNRDNGVSRYASVRPDGNLRPCRGMHMAGRRLGRAGCRRTGTDQSPPRRRVSKHGPHHGHGPRDNEPDPDGQRRHRRDHDARQCHHEGVLQEPASHGRGLRRRLFSHRRHRGATS